MRSLFIMDPLESVNVQGDSTYLTMRECCDRGYEVWFCSPERLFGLNGEAFVKATLVQVSAEPPYFVRSEVKEHRLDFFDAVWMRKDPPFNMDYIFTSYLLDFADQGPLLINHPVGLKLFNEKMWAMRFIDLHPDTLVSCDAKRLRDFVEGQAGRAVLKPWDGNGGRGVLVTQKGDRNLGSMIELLTGNGAEYVIAQPFLPGADQGDKRILLFDGEPVGAMLRVPSATDFRGNMHVGASVVSCELDARDREICDRLGPELKRWGLLFVGIDVIDGYLTEINLTSPTGIYEMNQLYSLQLEATLVDMAEQKCRERQQ